MELELEQTAAREKRRRGGTQHECSMEVKERRPYCSLSRSRRERGRDWEREGDREEGEGYREGPSNRRHTGSSSVLTQKSYSSSETLKAFDQHPSTQGLYGHRMPDMVPRDTEEYRAPGKCSLTFTIWTGDSGVLQACKCDVLKPTRKRKTGV